MQLPEEEVVVRRHEEQLLPRTPRRASSSGGCANYALSPAGVNGGVGSEDVDELDLPIAIRKGKREVKKPARFSSN